MKLPRTPLLVALLSLHLVAPVPAVGAEDLTCRILEYASTSDPLVTATLATHTSVRSVVDGTIGRL